MFDQLDFIYTPSSDPAADLAYFRDVLGAEVVFAVEAGEERVAAVRLDADGPLVLFAGHLEGERPFLIYRVENLEAALDELELRGWRRDEVFEIPHGPCCTFDTPGGHRVGLYELARPGAAEHFAGRADF